MSSGVKSACSNLCPIYLYPVFVLPFHFLFFVLPFPLAEVYFAEDSFAEKEVLHDRKAIIKDNHILGAEFNQLTHRCLKRHFQK